MTQDNNHLSRMGWALLLLAIIAAASLRLWGLGDLPPGLYRDEAANGIDAQNIVDGEWGDQNPFYFASNNGREPIYIYLTALSVQIFGNTAMAVRLAAVVIGTAVTGAAYLLATSWFNRQVGLLTAWLWAITLWPIHLSRIGLRPILLPLFLTLALWLATEAYRGRWQDNRNKLLWLLAGGVYGLSFYTYLAVRFTPLILILFIPYLFLIKRHKPLWPGIAFSAAGSLITISPLIILTIQQPDLVLGRPGQVSIFNEVVNNGSLLTGLVRNTAAALGMFFIKGDTIVRHNPPGRPIFDIFLIIPFLIGIVWCLRNWRRPPAAAVLLWTGVMLLPTLLAEDAPHFLRAVGILPALLMLPALGLFHFWRWTKLPARLGLALVIIVTLASLLVTINDYFRKYANDPETAYWFEAAARDLAENLNRESGMVQIDQRYFEGWPSLSFLVNENKNLAMFKPQNLSENLWKPNLTIYSWPHEYRGEVTAAIAGPALATGETGPLAKGDLDPLPYALYLRDSITQPEIYPVLANFVNGIQLRAVKTTLVEDRLIEVNLLWSSDNSLEQPLVAFVHIIKNGDFVGQSDEQPGQGTWPTYLWRQGLTLNDKHLIELTEEFDEDNHQIHVGLYHANSLDRIMVLDAGGKPVGDSWLVQP